tara:strand:- start:984 stop:1694 length:711 start_codon:yes stop_codon:yes gene_type:complete
MSITSKVRKKLWGKSGNRCAICKTELFSKEELDETLNIGEECHIISSARKGPRHKSGLLNYDSYENLLLLCRNHHIEIDTLIDSFPEELLMYMKSNHENWVKKTLEQSLDESEDPEPKLLTRMASGKELLSILSGIQGSRTDYDESSDEEENEFIGSVLQAISDYADLCGMGIEPFEKVKIASNLSLLLKELELKGYFLFAERVIGNIIHDGVKFDNWATATIIIKKIDSPDIVMA